MRPMSFASLLKTLTPSSASLPMPQPIHRLPSMSSRKPSGVPPVSACRNVRPLASFVPPSTTSKTLTMRGVAPAYDVELRLVRREGKAVRPVHLAGGHRELLCLWIPAVHVGWQLRLGHVAFVVAEDAERRVG